MTTDNFKIGIKRGYLLPMNSKEIQIMGTFKSASHEWKDNLTLWMLLSVGINYSIDKASVRLKHLSICVMNF